MFSTTFAIARGGPATVANEPASSPSDALFAELFAETPDEPTAGIMPLESLPTTMGGFEATAKEALERFEQLLRKRLEERHIAMEPPLQFATDASGQLHEVSGHPQADEVEQILAEDNRLQRYFQKAASHFEIAQIAPEHIAFQELYRQNPDLAVAMYSHLFDNNPPPPPKMSLQLDAEKLEPLFT